MRSLISALLIAALSGRLIPAWATNLPFLNENPEGTFRPYVYEFEAKLAQTYRVLVIEHDSTYGINVRSQAGQAIMDMVYASRKVRRDSFRETMQEVYRDKAPAEIEAILDKIDHNDRTRSLHGSRIIVLEGGVPIEKAKILGGLRLAMDGDNGRGLELEEALPGYRYPRIWEMRMSFGRHHDWVNQDKPDEPAEFVDVEPPHWLANEPELTGGTIQLTNFFNIGGESHAPEIGALIIFVASQISLRRAESMPYVRLNKTMKAEYSKLVDGLIPTPDFVQLMPMEVAAYADRRLAVNYYMRVMKFKNANHAGGAIQGQDYVVRQNLIDFEKIARDSFVYRDGRNRLHQAGIRRMWRPGQEFNGALDYVVSDDRPRSINDRWAPGPGYTWTMPAPLVRSHSEHKAELEPLICKAMLNGWPLGKGIWNLSHVVDMSGM